jgi:hypothetical protein
MIIEGRYWNCNGKGICVVATVNEGIDWTAYIGADNGYDEEECIVWTASHGAKLSKEDANHFFPNIATKYPELKFRY